MKTLRFLIIGTMAVLLSCFASSCKKGGHPDNFPEGCPNFSKHAYAGDLVDAMAPGIYEFKLSGPSVIPPCWPKAPTAACSG